MRKLTAAEARELSKGFRDLSVQLGDYRYAHWEALHPAQRRQLEDLEWSLLNSASDLTTLAVGLTLDDAQMSLAALKRSTQAAKRAIKRLEQVRQVLQVATSALQLAAAITTGDLSTIGKAGKALAEQSAAALS